MQKVDRQLVGTIDLADLDAICRVRGHELPYPFALTNAPAHVGRGSHALSAVSERFHAGDLRPFAPWLSAYADADIWVEGRVHHKSDHQPDGRVLACRAGDCGFLASQRPEAGVVDVYEVSAYELGGAVAESVGLTKPGSRTRIVVPQYHDYFTAPVVDFDDEAYSVSTRLPVAGVPTARVPDQDLSAVATVQSHSLPARSWGVDWGGKFLVWVRIADDGDYLYVPDFSHAEPLSKAKLIERIDSLIAEDVMRIRRRRGIG